MPDSPIFLDTSALVALLNRDDSWHEAAIQINLQLNQQQSTLVTTDWVLAEFLSWCARPPLRTVAERFVIQLQNSARVNIEAATRDNWSVGFELYQARSDKSWSLVDCISITACGRHAIQKVFTADHHFEQAA